MIEPYVFSYSELEDLRQCPFKHQLRWTERWKENRESPSQERGHRWHELMACYYGFRMEGVPPRRAARWTWNRHLFGDRSEEGELLRWMFRGYTDHWQLDREWRIHAVEVQIVVPVWQSIHLKIKADLIVSLRGDPKKRLWLVDAKTGRNLATQEELQMHAQFPLYAWAFRKMGIPVWGSIHDNVRTQRNVNQEKQSLESRHRRTLVHHNPRQLEIIARDAWVDMTAARDSMRQAGDRPRHLDPERCRHRCSFTEPCIAGMRGTPTRAFLTDIGFVKDPTRH